MKHLNSPKTYLSYRLLLAVIFCMAGFVAGFAQVITVPVGNSPISLAADAANGYVYVANKGDNTVSVINGSTNTVVSTINVGNVPWAVAVDAANGYVYVANQGDHTISVINGATNTVISTINVGIKPIAIAVDAANGDVYVTNSGDNTVSVINGSTNTVISTIIVGSNPSAVTVDAANGYIYVSNFVDNTISCINGATNTVTNTISAENTPNGLAVDPANGYLYIANENNGTVSVLNVSTSTLVTTINVGSYPYSVTVNAASGMVYVSNFGGTSVSVINGSTNTVTATITVGNSPISIAVDGANGDIYIANNNDNTVSVILAPAVYAVGGGANCSATDVTLSGSDNGVNYQLYNGASTVGAAKAGTGGVLDFGNQTAAGTYTVVATNATTTLTANMSGSATVNPTPTAYTVEGGANCGATDVVLSASDGVDPVNYYLYNGATQVEALSGGGGSIDFGSQTAAGTYTILATNISTGCTANMNGSATVNANPTVYTVGGGTHCGSADVTLSNSDNSTLYGLYVGAVNESSVGGSSGFLNFGTFSIPGTYTVVATDATTGCTANMSGSATVNPAVVLTPVSNQVLCPNAASTAVNFSAPATWTNNASSIGLAASGTGNIGSFTALNAGSSPVVATITATPSTAAYAYIANRGSNTVSVINTSSNTVVATIPVGSYPQGVAVSSDGTHAYVANQNSNSVSIISTATNTVTGTIGVGGQPIGVVVSADGSRLYTSNFSGNSVSVVNLTTNALITIIASVGSGPQGIAISPDGSKVYVGGIYSNNVTVINTATNTISTTVAAGTNPQSVAVNPDGSVVYVGNQGSSNVTVINATTNTVTTSISTGVQPAGISVSPDGSRLYVANYASGTVSAINTATNAVVGTITVGSGPIGVSVSSDNSTLYAANKNSNSVSVINTATSTVTTTVTVGSSPYSLGSFVTAASCGGAPISFTITVKPSPTVSASNTGAYTAGQTISLSASASADVLTGYTWAGPNSYSYTGSINPATITNSTTANTGTYTVTATDGNGCSGSASTSVVVTAGAIGITITNFTPTSGPIGSSVTITGTGYNTSAANDIVFFGATKATVTAASATSLTVTVPLGADYQYLSVTNIGTNLTAYSAKPYIVTFANGNMAFTNPINPVTATNPYSVFIADVDLDGKPDLIVTSTAGNLVSVFPNTSAGGVVQFGTRLDFATGTGPYIVVTGDIDGDGKPDLAVADQSTNKVSVLLNTSTGPGNFGFAAHVDFTTSSNPSSISINDIDGDGKPDLVASNQGTTVVSILRNTSTPGTASFAAAVNVSVGAGTRPIAVGTGDLDGDGKVDLAVTNYNGNSVSVFPNTSIPGTISFGTRIDITLPASTNPDAIAIGDLDGDGLPDLAVSSFAGEAVFLFRNTSAPGAISFAAYTAYSIPGTTFDIAMGDIDGDGKPDLATITNSTDYLYVLKNTSTAGNINFTSSSFATGTYPKTVKIGDLNGDGLPDMVETNWTSGTVGVFIQKVPYTWTGTTNTAWTTTTNWSPTAPVGGPNACTADVIIASAGRYPIIVSAVQVGNLQMDAGTQLTLNSNISVCKNLTGGTGTSATVTGTGLIQMNGAVAQTVSGYTAVQEIQISNTNGVVMQGSSKLDVSTALDLQTGNFDATLGTLTFKSTTSSNVGIIDNFSEGNIGTLTGNIVAERYYDASSTYSQHYFGSPIHQAALSQFGASGTAGYVTDLNCDETRLTNGSNYGNVFSYNEINGATCAMDEWDVVPGGNATDGQGYSVVKSGAGTLTLTGAANLGSTYTLNNLANSNWSSQTLQTHTYYSGWQLLSNPYLATMDITSTNSGFDNQIQVWNTTGQYAGSYQPSNVVAPFQAFLVHKTNAGGGGTFILNASNRVRTPQEFFDQSAEQLTLVATNTTTQLLDQVTVGFNQNATDTFDAQIDADKLPGSLNRHTIYSVNNGKWMSKNILHSILTTSTVPVGFEPGATGSYTIAFNGINTFDATSYVYLEDLSANTMFNARNGNYTFTADSSDSRNRFVLHFTPPTQIITVEATCTASGIINITQPGSANWAYVLTDNNNATVTSGTLNQTTPVSVGVAAGTYTLTLTDANNYTAVKVITINGPETISAAFNMSATAVQPQQPVLLTATGLGAAVYQWNLGNGTTETGATVTATYAQPGVYNLILTVINGAGCSSSTSKTITVNGATGLANVTGAENIAIWSHDNMVYVDFNQMQQTNANMIIFDILGQQISNEHYTGNATYQKEITGLDVAYLIVMVKNADKITTKKVFITNSK